MNRPLTRTMVWLVVVLATFAALGGVFGSQVQATPPGMADDVESSMKVFDQLLATVEENYASRVDPERAVYGAIDGMLRTLDPHSKFFDPKAFSSLRDDQKGRYFGLGITVTVRFGEVTVVSPPFQNSPAERAGLRVGDVITHVNDAATNGLQLDAVVGKLKGAKGTSVRVKIRRPGTEQPIEMSITRDEIPKYTVKDWFFIKPHVLYVKLESFSETTAKELRQVLDKPENKSLEGLVLDLRNNPGGLLQAAIDISSVFLQRGDLILRTGGRAQGSKRDYSSSVTNTNNLYPMVVLINKSSASASEIVSGAIQDHDRGLIVGETSFGKGLVQSVYQLKEDAGLALTTQKWYTPSGRLIQRDYSQISQFDYYNHRDNPDEKPKEIKRSDGGRVLYGGGGITPDHVVPEPKLTPFQESMVRRYAYFYFAQEYFGKNPGPLDPAFQASDALLAQFRQHLADKRGIRISDQDFQENKEYLKRMIRYEFVYDRIGVSEASKVLLEADPQVLKAVEYLPEAKELQNPKAPKRQLAQQE